LDFGLRNSPNGEILFYVTIFIIYFGLVVNKNFIKKFLDVFE